MDNPLDEYDALLGETSAGLEEPRREREREREGDERSRQSRERGNDFRDSRRRSRSRERRRSRSRDRDRDRNSRDRDRDARPYARPPSERRPAPRRRSPTPPEVRLARERERELKELERATRTVFVFNLSMKADERNIYEFFSAAGEVTDIRLITDRHTKRSKGLAYIEFSKQEEVFVALALTGQLLLGQPVMVKPAEAEKNLAWEAAQAAKAAGMDPEQPPAAGGGSTAAVAAATGGPLRLQVTGFKPGLGEAEIRQIFEPFGQLDSVSVLRDAAGLPQAAAHVVFSREAEGLNAMAHWHGKSLLDHVLAVTAVAAAQPDALLAPQLLPGAVAAAAAAAAAATAAAALGAGPVVGAGAGVGELDDDAALKLNTQTRAALMTRLASSAGMAVPGALPGGGYGLPAAAGAVPGGQPPGAADLSLQQGLLGPPSPIPTPCLLLKNMFAPLASAAEAQEVAEDVKEEASKFGPVLHCYADKDTQGFVYLKFASPEAAQAACKVLHGRFYNGLCISAAFQFVAPYNSHFSLAS